MITEDYISFAAKNFLEFQGFKFRYDETSDILSKTRTELDEKTKSLTELEIVHKELEMQSEDFRSRCAELIDKQMELERDISDL